MAKINCKHLVVDMVIWKPNNGIYNICCGCGKKVEGPLHKPAQERQFLRRVSNFAELKSGISPYPSYFPIMGIIHKTFAPKTILRKKAAIIS